MTEEQKQTSYQKSMALCDAWDKMYKKYGPEKLAAKMMKTQSYREYIRKWPFDFRLSVADIEDVHTPDKGIDLDDLVDFHFMLDEFLDSLTDHQKEVFELLQEGKTNSEIQEIMGFNTNSAVRFQKHAIKVKYYSVNKQELNEYVCKDCAFIYKDKTPLECPKCGSRNVLNTTPQAHE